MPIDLYYLVNMLVVLVAFVIGIVSAAVFLLRPNFRLDLAAVIGLCLLATWSVLSQCIQTLDIIVLLPDLGIRTLELSVVILILGLTIVAKSRTVSVSSRPAKHLGNITLLLGIVSVGMFLGDVFQVAPTYFSYVQNIKAAVVHLPLLLILTLASFFALSGLLILPTGLKSSADYYRLSRLRGSGKSTVAFRGLGLMTSIGPLLGLPGGLLLLLEVVLDIFGNQIAFSQVLLYLIDPLEKTTIATACAMILVVMALDPTIFLATSAVISKCIKDGTISFLVCRIGQEGPTPVVTSGFSFIEPKDKDSRFSYLIRLSLIGFSMVGLGSEHEPGSAILSVPSYPQYTGIVVTNRIPDKSSLPLSKTESYIGLFVIVPRYLEPLLRSRSHWEESFGVFVSTRAAKDITSEDSHDLVLNTLIRQIR